MKTNTALTQFEVKTIQDAFKRCYGLYGAVQNDTHGCFDALSEQTGIRATYLKEHAAEVREL